MEFIRPFGSSSVASRSSERAWLRRLLIPSVILVLCGSLAAIGLQSVRETLQRVVTDNLVTILKADVKALSIWLEHERETVGALCLQPEIRESLLQIVSDSRTQPDQELNSHPRLQEAQASILPIVESHSAIGFLVTDQSGRFVAGSPGLPLGARLSSDYGPYFEQVLSGKTAVIPPHRSVFAIPYPGLQAESGVPTIMVVGPVRDKAHVMGSLSLLFHPRDQFTEVLSVARSGQSGETYAVSDTALMLSESRFENQLRSIGLLADQESSILRIAVRNPGGNLTTGYPAPQDTSALSMTFSSASIADAAQSDTAKVQSRVEPFLDYRGVPVVGAWQWIPDYQFGVITEVDSADAFAPTRRLSYILWAFMGAASLSIAGLLFYSTFAQNVWRRLRRAEKQLEKLGQYELLEKIGEGGMSEVHRAQHAMLRRDTAIKLLRPTAANEVAISRFEREAQTTCRLQNPNTIQIFDYGRTPEGIFYYAMEFLEGIDLEKLVHQEGPLSDGRVVPILKRICQSLSEAHENNLVHRDIKPSNVMLCRRGGVCDAVKVLDFGLVRSLDSGSKSAISFDGSASGTPTFMSPESSQAPDTVDARSDLYSLGCVSYFLLAGKPPLQGNNPIETCWKHVRETPPPLSQHVHGRAAHQLIELTMQCLAKNPNHRPQSASTLLATLENITPLTVWTHREASAWWDETQISIQSHKLSASGKSNSSAG